jgi:hypothetical protein
MAMEENKVIQNKVEEGNWVRPEYKPMPEYNPDEGYRPMPEFIPTDLSTIDFSKYFEPVTKSLIECLTALNERPKFHGIFKVMYGE